MNPSLEPQPTPALTSAQIAQAKQRVQALYSATPSMTVDSFIWLHAAIFVGLDEDAGQLRSDNASLDAFRFARPALILPCLEDRFADLVAKDGYRTPDASAFYNGLAHHLSELHAIAPFGFGNRRTIAVHGEQLARAAGHLVNTCDVEQRLWDQALYNAFVHQELGDVAALLSGTPADAPPTHHETDGICGIARLPDRFLPRGRRQFMYLAAAPQELDEYLPLARVQAEQRISDLKDRNAPQTEIAAAQRERLYLDHPKGAGFQLDLLAEIGVRRIEVSAASYLSALERIREIAYGLMIALDGQTNETIEAANRRLRRPRYLRRGSPHQARMADQFLRNSAATNRSDPRFAAAQQLVDQAVNKSAQLKGRDAAAMQAAADQMRQDVANRIRTGALDIAGDGETTSPSEVLGNVAG